MKRLLALTLILPGAGFFGGALAEALPSPAELIVPGLIILLLVGLNGLYVAAEFAIIGARRTQLEPLAAAGNRTAQHVVAILKDSRRQDQYIATAQVGITIASLGLGMYGEPQVAHFLEPYLGRLLGQEAHAPLITALGYALGLGTLTYLHIVVGEMVPKSLALSAAVPTALTVSGPMRFSYTVMQIPVAVLNAIGAWLLRLLRIPPVGPHAQLHSPEELALIVDESAAQGLVNAGEREMVHNILDLGERHIHHVMTPRLQFHAIELGTPLPEILRFAAESPYSRFPVYEKDLDNVLGVLYLRDLVRQQARARGQFDLRLMVRPALVVPEDYPVTKVLAAFRRRHSHMAIVIDEFGGTAGLVTLADVVEEVLGDVGDEFNQGQAPIQPRPDGTVLIDGLTALADVNQALDLDLRDRHYNTIAGFVLGRLGRMARLGDTVEAAGVRLKVEALDGLRIARVSLVRLTPPEGEGGKGPDKVTG